MALWPRWLLQSAQPAWRGRLTSTPWVTGWAAGAALLAAAPAAFAAPGQAGAAVVLAVVFALACAASAAPLAPAAGVGAAAPLLAGAIAADASWPGAIFGAAVAGALGWGLRRRWRRVTRLVLEQTERLRRVEAERDAARRNDSDKSRFLAIASHDLRQPVHALGLFAATLHKRLRDSPAEPLARNLLRSVDALERSFNAMLDISRLDGDAVTPRLQTFPLRDVFRRLHMRYAGQAELAGLSLRFSPGGKSVTSDPQLLERIVGNLVQNAIRYTTRGGVAVVARSTHTHINVEVWDTGSGIASAELPRIFDEFYQVGRPERDRSQGLGMGLAIVKRLAQLLGHRLEVASTPGRGTLFRLGVPLGGLAGIDEEMAAADTVPMAVDVPQMVLVVDDEEPIREGLRLLLQEWGYQVITAADAAQAENAVSALEGRVDLVLSDLHLGTGPGGQDVITAVRRLCEREVPAILITGDAAGPALREVVSGSDPVLFKPVQPRHLFDAMRAALH
jgi:signal transduction histidine kinase